MPTAPTGPADDQPVDLKRDLEVFLDSFLPPTPSFSTAKVVHDGLWGTFRLNQAEVALLDTPLLQRLRHIRQMGFSSLIYPSATHTRFEHTLGVAHNVQRLCTALGSAEGEGRIDKTRTSSLRMAAMLHDIAHGPFSHSSEEIFGVLPAAYAHFRDRSPHESMAKMMLGLDRFRNFCHAVGASSKTNIDTERIGRCIVGEQGGAALPQYETDIINGPFDADKLDYLFRDSHFSGLPLSVDLERLWYTVRIGAVGGVDRLVVTLSGATPIEQILFSKMVLFSTVYHHHKVRTCDCMLAGIFEYMRDNRIPFDVRGRRLEFKSPVDFLWLTDDALLSFGFSLDKNDALHHLIHNLYFRRLLKRAMVLSMKTIEATDDNRFDDLMQLAKKTPEATERRREHARNIRQLAGVKCEPQEIWLDLPEMPNLRAANNTFVTLSDDTRQTPVPLSQIFPAEQWPKQYQMHRWRGHVFCPEEHRDKVAAAAKTYLQETFNLRIKPDAFALCKVRPPT